ncbi:MAG TPA: FUSC family protein [Amnibacterium sp.]|nr:FUSC family protein [Amnibacterium sp.]
MAGEGRTSPVARVLSPRAAWSRTVAALPAAVQLSVAATAAYAISRFLLGHPVPLLAITITLSSLGFVRDARPRRVLETALGLAIGVALAEALLLVVGRGLWQIAVALFLTLLLARLANASPAVAVAATAQSAIVLLLTLPSGGAWARSIDGFVGGAVALVATALLPRDPRRAALRDADRVFAGLRRGLDDQARALRLGSRAVGETGLSRLRALHPLVDDWTLTLDSAIAIARISPFLRHRLPELQAQRRLLTGVELAIRSLRTIGRRVDALVADGRPRPELAELLGAVGSAVDLLARSVHDPRRPSPPARTSC